MLFIAITLALAGLFRLFAGGTSPEEFFPRAQGILGGDLPGSAAALEGIFKIPLPHARDALDTLAALLKRLYAWFDIASKWPRALGFYGDLWGFLKGFGKPGFSQWLEYLKKLNFGPPFPLGSPTPSPTVI